MLALSLFKKSILLVSDNLGAALRVTALPYALLAGTSLYYSQTADMAALLSVEPGEIPVLPEGFASAVLVSLLVQTIVYLWVAVGWHRYVLLGEGGQGWLPPMLGGEMLGYLGRSVLLVLIAFFASLLVGVVFAVVGGLLIGAAVSLFMVPLVTFVTLVLFYRLGLILPAGAIGRPITLGQSWQATDGQTAAILMLAFMTVALSLVLQIPTIIGGGGLDPADPEALIEAAQPSVISTLYGVVVGWIILLVGICVLSTLYGKFIEGRSLD